MALRTDEAELQTDPTSETRPVRVARVGEIVAATYRITHHIGTGGSSHVFAAEHVRLGKTFAVKLLRNELDPSYRAVQRFRREAKAISKLSSEHIVSVVDCGQLDDQTPYLVMELLEGEELRSLLDRQGKLPARRAVQIVIEACRGLAVVHQAGLIHRDLKPANLFITRRSTGEDWCKVLDFGVAKMEASLSTVQGAIVGTVRYMAPEQLSDAALVGPSADVYALGAILYECLSGKAAQSGDTVQEVMFSVMNKAPHSLSALCPSLPQPLLSTVARCLSKQASLRPQSTTELASLLAASLAQEPEADAGLTVSEDAKLRVPVAGPARPARLSSAVLLALAVLVGAAFSWFIRPSRSHAPAETRPTLQPLPVACQQVEAPGSPSMLPAPPPVPTAAGPTPPASKLHTPNPPKPTRAAPATASKMTPPLRTQGSVGSLDQANPYSE